MENTYLDYHRIYINAGVVGGRLKRRQMAVSAMFHIKGDGLHAKLAP